jgi:hypothetical protein
MLNWPPKDPDEILDYQIDWADRLGVGDTIQTSTWTVPAGITGSLQSAAAQNVTIWLSGGTVGKTYQIHNRIISTGGRTMDQTVGIAIRTK